MVKPDFFVRDHLGSVRAVVLGDGRVLETNSYYPYGLRIDALSSTNYASSDVPNRYKYNGKELFEELQWLNYGARFYDAAVGRWWSRDPKAEKAQAWTPYRYAFDSPVNVVDPDGRFEDWVERADGTIYWDENATSPETTKPGEKYLGKNVLVATHNRDENLSEPINSARFDLYLESNKNGPTATIYGNTVPADVKKYGTLKEGLYPASYCIYHGDGAILINEGKDLPTVRGNPNNPKNYNPDGTLKPVNEQIMNGILFHKGNYARFSLTTLSGKPISEGCQTGGCGPGSLPKYREFIKKARGFKGYYYLRAKPKKYDNVNYIYPKFSPVIDNTYVAKPKI